MMMRPLALLLPLGAVLLGLGACASTPPAVPLDGPSGLQSAVVEAFGME